MEKKKGGWIDDDDDDDDEVVGALHGQRNYLKYKKWPHRNCWALLSFPFSKLME